MYLFSVGGSDNTKNKFPLITSKKVCGVVILTTVDIFKLEFISVRFTTFFTLTKISNTKKHQISAYKRFENVSLLYIYFQWVAATTLRTKFKLITSKKCVLFCVTSLDTIKSTL